MTFVKTVGGNQKPLSGIGQVGLQRSAPSASPDAVSSSILLNCMDELMAPISVFLSSGSPRRRVVRRRFKEANASSATDSEQEADFRRSRRVLG